ncbi:hypothetical protein [Candidatus Harpocratesius sp.]
MLVEIYIITKTGTLLHKYDIINSDQNNRDQLIGGFLTALNGFAQEIGFPEGVSLIRSGNLEARFSPGTHVFSVLMINYSMPLGYMVEPILSGMAKEITELFETAYEKELISGEKKRIYRASEFESFRTTIDNIIDKFGSETIELYQKLILIEGIYAKIPQKWVVPLMERISLGENILEELFRSIPEIYHRQLLKVIKKVNLENRPIWEIFAIPLLNEHLK